MKFSTFIPVPVKALLRPLASPVMRASRRRKLQRFFEDDNRRRGAERGVLRFAPGMPLDSNVITKICLHKNWAIEGSSSKAGITIFWPDNEEPWPQQPQEWINGGCVDINKSTVSGAFHEAFGWSYALDPSTHQGPMVCKSDRNAQHDGLVVVGPTPARVGCFYQMLVDNIYDEEVQDIRAIWMRTLLPFVYVKYRPLASRFKNRNSRALIQQTAELISPDEVKRIGNMCRLLKMDYGEIDCLRDRVDGRLHVVDLNRTPAGPPNGLPADEAAFAIKAMADLFNVEFLRRYRD